MRANYREQGRQKGHTKPPLPLPSTGGPLASLEQEAGAIEKGLSKGKTARRYTLTFALVRLLISLLFPFKSSPVLPLLHLAV